jgi:hypothetical protein
MDQRFQVATVAGKLIIVGTVVTFVGFIALLIYTGVPVSIGLSISTFL